MSVFTIPIELITYDICKYEPFVRLIKFKEGCLEKGSYWEKYYHFPDEILGKEHNNKIYLPYMNDKLYFHNKYLMVKYNDKFAVCSLDIKEERWCEGCGKDSYCRKKDCMGYLYFSVYCENIVIANLSLKEVLDYYYNSLNLDLDPKRNFYNFNDKIKFDVNPKSRL